jgi:hypothetical protein
MSSKTKEQVEAVVDALDDVPIDPKDARETVTRLGVDVKSLAAGLRAKVAAADEADRKRTIEAARIAYAREIEQFERRKVEPLRPRAEQIVVLQALLAKAPQSVAVHFHKYESASDDELGELIRALRHLLNEDEAD